MIVPILWYQKHWSQTYHDKIRSEIFHQIYILNIHNFNPLVHCVPKWNLCRECRPRSDAEERGVRSESTLFANMIFCQKYFKMSQLMRLWYLSHRRPAEAQASLRTRAVSPGPSLFAHMKYGSRQRVRPKIWHIASLGGCTCAFEDDEFTEDEMYHYLMRRLKYCKKIHQTPPKSGYNTHTVNEDGGASPLEIFGFKYPSLQQGQLLSVWASTFYEILVFAGGGIWCSSICFSQQQSSKDFGKVSSDVRCWRLQVAWAVPVRMLPIPHQLTCKLNCDKPRGWSE